VRVRHLLQSRRAAWLGVAACVAVIWTLSGDDFSSQTTGSLLLPLLHWLFPELSGQALLRLHLFVRKSAHFGEYALLGLLAFRALWLTLESTAQRVGALALLLVLAVAGADETRQSLSQARTGSLWDVALDLCGAAAALLLLLLLRRAWGSAAEAESA